MPKKQVDEFKLMIDRALDREELETIREMLLELPDVTFSEKEQISTYLDERYKQAPELRQDRCD